MPQPTHAVLALADGTVFRGLSIGAEGIKAQAGAHLLVEDEPVAFADAVVRLYSDESLWNTLSGAGLRHMQENYTPDKVATVVEHMIREALRG